jgi:hypothetical protein
MGLASCSPVRVADRRSEDHVHLPGRLFLHPRQHVAVGVHCNADPCMPQALTDDLGMDAGTQEVLACVWRRSWNRMRGTPALHQGFKVPLDEVPGIERLAIGLGKDQSQIVVLRPPA